MNGTKKGLLQQNIVLPIVGGIQLEEILVEDASRKLLPNQFVMQTLHGSRSKIDSGDFESLPGKKPHFVSLPATGDEHASFGNPSIFPQPDKRRRDLTDIPGQLIIVIMLLPV